VEVRERYALPPEEARVLVASLKPAATEALFLSTCNRVEFYLLADDPEAALDRVRRLLQERHRLKDAEIAKYFCRRDGVEAFRHLFRVAGSLDSMVVGEAQILGQVKDAYQAAVEANTAGPLLNGAFQRAFASAKRIRSQTDIARLPVSVSSVAVDLALKIFSRLEEHRALVLGAGEMSESAARHLVSAGVGRFWVANRTLEKAKALAHELGGTAMTLEQGLDSLHEAYIVLSSVGGDRPTLTADRVQRAMDRRRGKPLFLIDIGVPRNIEPEAGRLDSVYLFNIDDLSRVAQSNRDERSKALALAEAVLEEELQGLLAWVNNLSLVPTITRLRERVEEIRGGEWADFLRRNPGIDPGLKEKVEHLTRSLAAKFLHEPTVRLKKHGVESQRFRYARALRDLFGLDGPSGPGAKP
jgi:glutamyl-tRNA reductase